MKESPVLWITGLAGAGKTTLANEVYRKVVASKKNVVQVDGDSTREICGNDLGYSQDDRLKNAYRISRLCKFLNDQNLFVICSTISLIPEIWDWNRKNFRAYIEVFLKVDMATLASRNKKGLYDQTSAKGCVMGVDQAFSEPTRSDYILSNGSSDALADNANMLTEVLLRDGGF